MIGTLGDTWGHLGTLGYIWVQMGVDMRLIDWDKVSDNRTMEHENRNRELCR